MRIVGKECLEPYLNEKGKERYEVDVWLYEVYSAKWTSAQDIKVDYVSAKFFSSNEVVFHLKESQCQLRIKVNYKYGIVLIKEITSVTAVIKNEIRGWVS